MSLPTSCLAIGKTCCHPTFKNGLHQRLGREPTTWINVSKSTFGINRQMRDMLCEKRTQWLLVDHIIGGGLIKGVVELEYLVVQVLGEIHLLLGLMNKQGTFSWHRHHIDLLFGHLWKTSASEAEASFNIPASCPLYINIYSIYSSLVVTYPACSAVASEHRHKSCPVQSIQVRNKYKYICIHVYIYTETHKK